MSRLAQTTRCCGPTGGELAMLAAGATQAEIVRDTGWSRRTVSGRLSTARARLGARSTAEAVSIFSAAFER